MATCVLITVRYATSAVSCVTGHARSTHAPALAGLWYRLPSQAAALLPTRTHEDNSELIPPGLRDRSGILWPTPNLLDGHGAGHDDGR